MTVPVHEVDLGRERCRAWFTGRRPDGGDRASTSGNLSHSRPHRPDQLASDRREVAEATGQAVERWHLMRQVHGAEVGIVDESTPIGAEIRGVDALVTDQPLRPLLVQVADCVPILLATDHAVGVAHAGRRGVGAGVVEAAVERLVALGSAPVSAWVGPCIGGCCYELPAEMHDEFATRDPAASATTTWGAPSVDLGRAVVERLRALEVDVRRMSTCTRCDTRGRWFSHRSDPSAGRFVGMVVRGAGR